MGTQRRTLTLPIGYGLKVRWPGKVDEAMLTGVDAQVRFWVHCLTVTSMTGTPVAVQYGPWVASLQSGIL